jgi:hypothetical protein
VITKTNEWVGEGNVEEAIAAVRPENRTQQRPESTTVAPVFAKVFDELYSTVHEGKGLTRELIEKLNRTNEQMLPQIREHQRAVAEDAMRRRAQRRPGDPAEPGEPGDPNELGPEPAPEVEP